MYTYGSMVLLLDGEFQEIYEKKNISEGKSPHTLSRDLQRYKFVFILRDLYTVQLLLPAAQKFYIFLCFLRKTYYLSHPNNRTAWNDLKDISGVGQQSLDASHQRLTRLGGQRRYIVTSENRCIRYILGLMYAAYSMLEPRIWCGLHRHTCPSISGGEVLCAEHKKPNIKWQLFCWSNIVSSLWHEFWQLFNKMCTWASDLTFCEMFNMYFLILTAVQFVNLGVRCDQRPSDGPALVSATPWIAFWRLSKQKTGFPWKLVKT